MQALAQAQLLEIEILAGQLDFALQRGEIAVVRHQHAEQIGHVLQRGLGALGLCADQAQHGIDAVEQEMRPDARLQRLQPRLGQRRRQGAVAQVEVVQDQRRWRRAMNSQ